MNSIHDMGGMQGFGPIVREPNEPVFHARWEARVMALRRALAAGGKLPSTLRPAIERIPPADYLRMSYYELWFTGLVELLSSSGLATREELATGKPAAGSPKSVPALKAPDAAAFPHRVPQVMLSTQAKPAYSVGQHVRARNLNPTGHTRLPRYARGRSGVIFRHQGVQAFPDTHVHKAPDHPQHVYTVHFTARELWGEQASPRDSVYLDLWEGYLESAS